ncbi:putative flavin dependent monooxygenase [Apiosordaria backusii]|uniref:Flavin dependent monooxygenase n=1 Tax=Apiosordaria backusii TaxID=314023 RepID=A0AA39ZPU2_9PEZI|nr:putative flavin dependent monooxygenase [Apiosordaria backusii]
MWDNTLRASPLSVPGPPELRLLSEYLAAESRFGRITVFEQRDTTGGMWNYTLDNAKARFPTPVYDELESNIPKELMAFSDLQFPQESQLFATHETVLEYLRQYSKEVTPLIQFHTQVLEVAPVGTSQWIVTTEQSGHEKVTESVFDAVVVANGHFETPLIPDFNEQTAWKRLYPESISHSLAFKNAANFRNKKVIVVGAGASGTEIASQLESVVQHPLIISKRSHTQDSTNPPGRLTLPAIAELIPSSRSVRFVNGHLEHDIDHIILCTGYRCDYPFLRRFPALYDGFCTRNLYRNIFYIPRPTLAFIAMPLKSVPFPLSESQAAVVARVWANRLALPSQFAMSKWDDAFRLKYGGRKVSPLEAAHFNISLMEGLYDWAVQATRQTSLINDGQGKLPPRWTERDLWLRERLGPMKAAFTAHGSDRHRIRTPEELGFDFEQWKRDTGLSEPSRVL